MKNSKKPKCNNILCPEEALCAECDALITNLAYDIWQSILAVRYDEYLSYPPEVRYEAQRTSVKWL